MKRYAPPAKASPHIIGAEKNTRPPEALSERVLYVPMKSAAGPLSNTPRVAAKAKPETKHKENNAGKWKTSFQQLDESNEDVPVQTDEATLPAPEDQDVLRSTRSPENYEDGRTNAPVDPELNPLSTKKRASKWGVMYKSTEQQVVSGEPSTSSVDKNRTELYDPFDTQQSDSEVECPEGKIFPSDQDYRDWKSVSTAHSNKSWESSQPPQRDEPVPESSEDIWTPGPPRPSERVGFSRDPLEVVSSASRALERRSLSPDRTVSRSYPERFSYEEERMKEGEELEVPKYRREITSRVRLSPPPSKDYQHSSAHTMKGVGSTSPSREEAKIRKRSIIMDKNPINCELCDIELASGQELENHLDSRTHWDTMAFIQQKNNFDDLIMAFLQEVMLNKCFKCSPDVDPRVLERLQEKDHMTKVEIFHCAACRVFVSTSVDSVQKHITSEEHIFNTQDSEVDRREACLEKADQMLKQWKPELDVFLKGGSPFP